MISSQEFSLSWVTKISIDIRGITINRWFRFRRYAALYLVYLLFCLSMNFNIDFLTLNFNIDFVFSEFETFKHLSLVWRPYENFNYTFSKTLTFEVPDILCINYS